MWLHADWQSSASGVGISFAKGFLLPLICHPFPFVHFQCLDSSMPTCEVLKTLRTNRTRVLIRVCSGQMSRAGFHGGTLSSRSRLNLSPPLAPPIFLLVSVHRLLLAMAAPAIPVDLLMDLIAFQLIAPHANTKLNQTEVPSTGPITNLIPLDIIIRWYWLLMTQRFENRWVSMSLSSRRAPWQAALSGSYWVQVSLLRSAAHCAVIDNMLVTLSAEMHYAFWDLLIYTRNRCVLHTEESLITPTFAVSPLCHPANQKLLGSLSKLIKPVTWACQLLQLRRYHTRLNTESAPTKLTTTCSQTSLHQI